MCFDEEPRDEHEECSREIHDLEKLAVRCEAHQGEVSERCVCCEAVEVKRLQLRRFTVEVLGAETAIKPSKYTVECHGRDDAMLIAFALDGGWTRGDGSDADASGMLPLAQEYCAILHEEAAEAKD